MARPTRRVISSGIAAWDADVDFNFDLLTGVPLAIKQYTLVGDLPAAGSYDDCLALVGSVMYISDGATWNPYFAVSANIADSTAVTVADMATDFNTLLAALQAAGLMA